MVSVHSLEDIGLVWKCLIRSLLRPTNHCFPRCDEEEHVQARVDLGWSEMLVKQVTWDSTYIVVSLPVTITSNHG